MSNYFLALASLVFLSALFVFGISFFRKLSGSRVLLVSVFLLSCIFLLGVNFFFRNEGASISFVEEKKQYLPLVDRYLSGAELENPNAIDAKSFIRIFQVYLQKNSDDWQAWLALGNILKAGGIAEASLTAYERAYQANPLNIDVVLTYVNARLSLSKQKGAYEKDEKVIEVLEDVLKYAPNNANALMLLGAAGFQGGDYALAERSWTRLKDLFYQRQEQTGEAPPEDVIAALDKSIAEAVTLKSRGAESKSAKSFSKEIEVSISDNLVEEIRLNNQGGQNLTLFVFVRSALNPDNPMPLAAIRKPLNGIKEFPVSLSLDNSNSLMGQDLSREDTLLIQARVSTTGEAIKRKGDLESDQKQFKPGGSRSLIELEISKSVE